ncbi:acyl carrier protein [Nocardia colli]|uniref:acyl carrier protein n=1 Tax=Nocardia colli TaxID=2545717 RepID=UPI0035DB04BD
MATNQEDIIAVISAIIEEVIGFDADEVTIDKSFVEDMNIDWLSMIEIVARLESNYGISITDGDLDRLRTVRDAVECIRLSAIAPGQ